MGRPTVVVATDRFSELAQQSAEQLGLREARIVVVAHPIGGVGDDELDRRADRVADEMMSRLSKRER